MKKIISLFMRNYEGNRLVRDEVVPGAEWVVAGEGTATRKWDGTACMVRGGQLYKRYDAKKGKTPPAGWEPCEDAPDEHTGHWPGWILVGEGPEDKWFRVAREQAAKLPNGTYELCGPHFQSNPEDFPSETLIPHGVDILTDAPRAFSNLPAYFVEHRIEGIVWHHPDGRMVKIKARDFGLPWPRK